MTPRCTARSRRPWLRRRMRHGHDDHHASTRTSRPDDARAAARAVGRRALRRPRLRGHFIGEGQASSGRVAVLRRQQPHPGRAGTRAVRGLLAADAAARARLLRRLYGYIRSRRRRGLGADQSDPVQRSFSTNGTSTSSTTSSSCVPPSGSAGCSGRRGDQGDHRSASGLTVFQPPRGGDAPAVKLQTGYVYHYAFAMLLGVAVLISWYLVGGVR